MAKLNIKSEKGLDVELERLANGVQVSISDGTTIHRHDLIRIHQSADGGALELTDSVRVNVSPDTAARALAFKEGRAIAGHDAPFIEVINHSKTKVTYDGNLVTISRGGFFDPKKGEKSILIEKISSVQLKEPGLTVGYIQFIFSGSSDLKSGVFDAVHDENSVLFLKQHLAQMKALRSAIMSRVMELKAPPATVALSSASAADEIEKLAALKDRGILTEDEFNAKKRQLLGL